MVGSFGKIIMFLSRMSPVIKRCAGVVAAREVDLGIDPRRADSGVCGWLVGGFAQQLGGQVAWENGSKGTIVCLTGPSSEAFYNLRPSGVSSR